jgi:type I restriction enzyme M protein
VPNLVAEHSNRIREQINQRELEEVERMEAEYKEYSDKFAKFDTEIAELQAEAGREEKKTEKAKLESKISKLESQRSKFTVKIAERDERITEVRRRAEEYRKAVADVGHELGNLYGDPDELLKHARVVSIDEIQENEYNLNIPRYVDTFEPEPRIEVKEALAALTIADRQSSKAETQLRLLLRGVGYAS